MRFWQCVVFGMVIGRLFREWQVNILIGLLLVVLYAILMGIEDHRIRREEESHEASIH